MKGSAFLKEIEGGEATIQATTGKDLICNAIEIFTGRIDQNFKNHGLDKESESSPETKIKAFEIIKKGTLKAFFYSLGVSPKKLALTQSQIIEIIKNHKDLLNKEGTSFFLLREANEYLVVRVDLYSSGNLYVSLLRFDEYCVWSAHLGHRVITPDPQNA